MFGDFVNVFVFVFLYILGMGVFDSWKLYEYLMVFGDVMCLGVFDDLFV